ncbi:hypothetical protein SeLEV6574_g00210 [Synchytrium endobioticum]|nr:hypothetical protein SeLEV6574_g00210 [Synchytrium endobioticum]
MPSVPVSPPRPPLNKRPANALSPNPNETTSVKSRANPFATFHAAAAEPSSAEPSPTSSPPTVDNMSMSPAPEIFASPNADVTGDNVNARESVNATQVAQESLPQLSQWEEIELLKKANGTPTLLDEEHHLLSIDWFKKWADHLKLSRKEPGPVDNTSLFTDKSLLRLRDNLAENLDFVVLPQRAFRQLVNKYGLVDPNHQVRRRAIPISLNSQVNKIEIHLEEVQVTYLNPPNKTSQDSQPRIIPSVSKCITVGDLKLEACKAFGVTTSYPDMASRLWLLQHGNKLKVCADNAKLYDVFHQETISGMLNVGLETRPTSLQQWPDDNDVEMTDVESSGATPAGGTNGLSSSSRYKGLTDLLFDNIPTQTTKETPDEKRTRVLKLQRGQVLTTGQGSRLPIGLVEYSSQEPLSRATEDPSSVPPAPSSYDSTTITAASSSLSSRYNNHNSYKSRRELPVGAVGLNNLGNTCFMNSALQCLSNASPLTLYFASGRWGRELNRDNPLGKGGEVAEAYADVISHIWQAADPRPTSFAPRDFKGAIGKASSQFLGYSQQDSQELLGFLLDGLHEDLNRIRKKPYTELPDYNGEPDEQVAQRSWDLYLQRNNSIIVDLFQGQYKSRVECRECHRWSIKFDPYMFLSVPVPDRRELTITVTVVPAARQNRSRAELRPIKMQVVTPKEATIKILKQKISEKAMMSITGMTVVEIHSNKVYKIFSDSDRVDSINSPSDVIYVAEAGTPDWDLFEVPEEGRNPNNIVHIPVYLAVAEAPSPHYPSSSSFFPTSRIPKVFGVPLMLSLPSKLRVSLPQTDIPLNSHAAMAKQTQLLGERLYKEVVRGIRRYSERPLFKRAREEQASRNDDDESMSAAAATPATMMSTTPARPSDDEMPATATKILTSESMEYTLESDETLGESRNERLQHPPQSAEPSEAHPIEFSDNDAGAAWVPLMKLFKLHLVSQDIRTSGHSVGHGVRMHATPAERYGTFLNTGWQQEMQNKFTVYPFDAHVCAKQSSVSDVAEPRDDDKAEKSAKDRAGGGEAASSLRPYEIDLAAGTTHILLMTEWESRLAKNVFGEDFMSSSISSGAFAQDLHPDYMAETSSSHEAKSTSKDTKPITLEDCLQEFMKEEIMGEDDTWFCPACQKHQRSMKKIDLWSVPEILVFHLKRFSSSGGRSYSWRAMVGDKIDSLVQFPTTGLDMTDFVIGRDSTSRNPPPRRRCPNEVLPLHTKTAAFDFLSSASATTDSVVRDEPISEWPVAQEGTTVNCLDYIKDANPSAGLDNVESPLAEQLQPNNEDLWFDDDEHEVECTPDGMRSDDDRLIYDLIGVSNHYGGMGGGHYTAYAKNPIDGQWYHFDDSSVSKTSEDNVVTTAAYLVFYQRRRRTDHTSQKLSQLMERMKSQPPPGEPKHFSASSFNSWTSSAFSSHRPTGTSSLINMSSINRPFGALSHTPDSNTLSNTPIRPSSPVDSMDTGASSTNFIGPILPSNGLLAANISNNNNTDSESEYPSFFDMTDKGKSSIHGRVDGDGDNGSVAAAAETQEDLTPLLAAEDDLPGYESLSGKSTPSMNLDSDPEDSLGRNVQRNSDCHEWSKNSTTETPEYFQK